MNKDFAFLVLMFGLLAQTIVLIAAIAGWEHIEMKEFLQSEWVVIAFWAGGMIGITVGIAGLVYDKRR